jgi:hypothetical protein
MKLYPLLPSELKEASANVLSRGGEIRLTFFFRLRLGPDLRKIITDTTTHNKDESTLYILGNWVRKSTVHSVTLTGNQLWPLV